MTTLPSEDKLLFFLSTSLEITPILADLEEKYAYALKFDMGADLASSIMEQIAYLEISKNICSAAAQYLLLFDAVHLN